MSNIEIKVPNAFKEEFFKSIEKYNKKADKLEITKPVILEIGQDKHRHGDITIELTVYSVSFETIKLNGYTVISRIYIQDGVFLVNSLSIEHENLLNEYHANIKKSNNFYCEHCKSNRDRQEVFLVIDEQGTIKQVGSSCLKDFTGHANPVQLSNYYFNLMIELLNYDISENEDSEEFFGKIRFQTSNLLRALQVTIRLVNEGGYIPKSAEQDFYNPQVSTVTLAWANITSIDYMLKFEATDKEIEESKEILKFIEILKPESGYVINLKSILESGYITSKTSGLFLSSVKMYRNHLNKIKEEQQNASLSNHMHTPGDKVNLKLRVTNAIPFENFMGKTSFINMFEDESGNIYKWFTSYSLAKFENETLEIKGTVKDHDNFRGIKSTVLTRCKVKD